MHWAREKDPIQRGLLDCLLPLWTLPFVCEISDKLQVVNKELTRDWVNSKVADIEFYSQKKLKRYYQ